MNRRGKCPNYAGCLLAYRNETITVTEGDFVCPECKTALTPADDETKRLALKPALMIIGGVVLLAVIGVVVMIVSSTSSRLQSSSTPAAASPEPTAAPAASPQLPPIVEATPALPVATGSTPLATPPVEQPAEAPKAVQPDMDMGKEENRTVKTEVLKRIDLMPTISAENKDKLYVSVERARQMGKVIMIPFASGKTALSAADAEGLQREVQNPAIQSLLEDPTAVFVILGFADTKGDEKINLRISQERADSVLRTLREKCGVMNVMHAVGMGGSTLFDSQGVEKNRVAEVWVVCRNAALDAATQQ